MSVARAQREIDSQEFAEWQAYCDVTGPIGEEAAWLRHGILTANVVAPHLKRGETARASDFIPKFGSEAPKEKEPRVQPAEEQRRNFRAAMRTFNRSKR